MYLGTADGELGARFAPAQNRGWLAYHSSSDADAWEVYVRQFPGKGGKLPISRQGGRFPVWGPDARELFYVGLDNRLMVVEVSLGPSPSASTPRELFQLPLGNAPVLTWPFDTVDGQRFLVLAPVGSANRPLEVVINWPSILKR
jgi:hypothetical protein